MDKYFFWNDLIPSMVLLYPGDIALLSRKLPACLIYAIPFAKFLYSTLSITFPLLLDKTTIPLLLFNLNDVLSSPCLLLTPLV